MDAITKAANEALAYAFEQYPVNQEHLQTLMLHGHPSNNIHKLTATNTHALNYDAAATSAWQQLGIETLTLPKKNYDLIIHFIPKSDLETQFERNRALHHLKEDGTYIAIVHNRMGAGRIRKQLTALFSTCDSLNKSKCKVWICQKKELTALPDMPSEQELLSIKNTDYKTKAGVYGGEKVDEGSALLAEILRKEHWRGIGADLGCGYGYLMGEILKTRHKVQQVNLYENDLRALQMAEKNLINIDNTVKLHSHWVDVTQKAPIEKQAHWAVMNPPFHRGVSQDYALGQTFIEQAATILRPGGQLFMVANQHLPYEETLYKHFRSLVKLVEKDGFKCYRAVH